MTKKTLQNPKPKQSHKAAQPEKQAFIEHVYELRARLFWVVATLLIASSIAFIFKDLLVDFVLAPLHGEKLVYLTIGGGFSFIFTVCLYFGAVAAVPVIIYHLYKFLQPVITHRSRKLTVSIVFASAALAIAGAAFGYFVAIRASIDFLMGFADGAITSSVTADSYLNFIIMYTAGLAIVFQLPLLLFIFDHIRPFPPGKLMTSQRYVITAAVIIAALITPTPDIVNQMIIALPIVAIYELGALVVFMRRLARQKAQKPPVEVSNQLQPEEATVAQSQQQERIPTKPLTSSTVVASRKFVNDVVAKKSVLQTQKQEEIRKVPVVKQQPVRSVDGFRARPSNLKVTIPERSMNTPQPQRLSMIEAQPIRKASVDGIL